jgi:iron complex transport system ATP-binding protein
VSLPILELTDVTFRYGAQDVVAGISLSLSAGRFVGILGPNGSGKSTLMRLAAGLLPPASGEVRLAGRDLKRCSRMEVGRQIALLPQEAVLPMAFTGREIVGMGRTPHLGWLTAESSRDRAVVQRALTLVGAAHYADRRIEELSGGERQRLLFARVLAQEPDVLLLDEPTVHLDLTHQLAVLNTVRGLQQTAELAVLGIFHEINLAIEYCDELVFMMNGRVVAQGSSETIVTSDLIREVYGVDLPIVYHPESGRPAVLYPAARRSPSHSEGAFAKYES